MHQQTSSSSSNFATLVDTTVKYQHKYRYYQSWRMYKQREHSNKRTESKLRDTFAKLLKESKRLVLTVTDLLVGASLSTEEETLLRLTNPDHIQIEPSYQGLHIGDLITTNTFVDLIKSIQKEQILHAKYVCVILHQARILLKSLPNAYDIDLSILHHIFIIGDLHGRLTDLLHIFNANGLPSRENPYIFNGDFVDRGSNSVEVILLLLVALILYPSSVFLNRGNHEDYLVTMRYGFEKEISQKYPKHKILLLELFKDLFSWLPIYASVNAGKSKLMIVHGGISDRIQLSRINALARNRYVSLSVLPRPTHASRRLTKDELDEYFQLTDLLWCDPDPEGRLGCRKNDNRSMACYFGSDVTENFLSTNNFSMLIRSHEIRDKGYAFEHNNKVLTIFTASNYNDEMNGGAVARWDYNMEKPWIMSYALEDIVPIEEYNFTNKISLFQDSVYQALVEKIKENKSLLEKEFKRLDDNQTNHISPAVWVNTMTNVLKIDLPWFQIRSKFVLEDAQGIEYNSMFEGYAVDNMAFQKTQTDIQENIYTSKDELTAIFNIIDSDRSGFISYEQLSNALKLLSDEDEDMVDIISLIDLDNDGRIDINEFLEAYRLVNKQSNKNTNFC